jgi:ABC-type antimicrobial peptide transport system permease subunit
VTKAVTGAIHQVNPHQVVFDVKTMERVIANSLSDIQLYLWLVGLFASLALLLAVSGVYGVISYVVTARTQEFGIRLALGAEGAQILCLVLGHCSGLVACGVVLGTAGALAVARLLKSLLNGVTTADPATLAAVAVLLALVGLAAALVPARRAMRVDPVTALR